MADVLFLVRHGETVWNAEGRIHGRTDSPLTTDGVMQAAVLAKALAGQGVSQVFCSPQGRAIHTASIIAEQAACAVLQDERLDERNFGNFEGRRKIDIAREGGIGQALLRPMDATSKVPGGESMGETAARVLRFLHMVHLLPDQAVAAVTHSHALQSLLGALMGSEDYEQFRHDNASYSIIRWMDDRPSVIRWNVTDHVSRLAPDQAAAGIATGAFERRAFS
jgi:2,3-bisphosphoglycerate-dependent phosphoglycerate mutase